MNLASLIQPIRKRWLRPVSEIDHYIANGRKPWSRGYSQYKEAYIGDQLGNAAMLNRFHRNQTLPEGYGLYLDERVVEYPWFFSRLASTPSRMLDAGSALNHRYLLAQKQCTDKDLTVLTLEPESECQWQRRISYVFADLRDLPFKVDWFDEIVSISTIEHVGKDNTALYSANPRFKEDANSSYLDAVRELRRICKPGGKVYITVPYGRPIDYGWYQQFDANMIRSLLQAFAPSRATVTYYHYTRMGWNIASPADCEHAVGFDIHQTRHMNPKLTADYDDDLAAASRAIAALEMEK